MKVEYAAAMMYMGEVATVQYGWRFETAEECAGDLTDKDKAAGWVVARITVEPVK